MYHLSELELAIEFLERRAISTKDSPDEHMKISISVLPASEVKAVLQMVKEGTFSKFHEQQKALGSRDCV